MNRLKAIRWVVEQIARLRRVKIEQERRAGNRKHSAEVINI